MKTTVWIPIPLDKRIELERLLTDRNPAEMIAFLTDAPPRFRSPRSAPPAT